MTVYFRLDPSSPPDPWFTVVVPYVDGPNGHQILVKYGETGNVEYIDRRPLMRSAAARNEQLVIHRSEATR